MLNERRTPGNGKGFTHKGEPLRGVAFHGSSRCEHAPIKGAKMATQAYDSSKPAAMAIPKEGYFKLEQGNYGPIFPRTPSNYGFTIIAKVKPGREAAMRTYADVVEGALKADPQFLEPLKLHYLKWVLFDIEGQTYFMYQGIFDTDFDKYTDDAVALFLRAGLSTAFENLEGFP